MESLRRPFFSRTEKKGKKKKRTGDERKKKKKGGIWQHQEKKRDREKNFFSSQGTKKYHEGKKNLQDLQKTYLRRLSRRNENRSGIAGGGRVVVVGIRDKRKRWKWEEAGVDEGSLLAATVILLFVGWWKVSFSSFCSYPWLFWLVFRQYRQWVLQLCSYQRACIGSCYYCQIL